MTEINKSLLSPQTQKAKLENPYAMTQNERMAKTTQALVTMRVDSFEPSEQGLFVQHIDNRSKLSAWERDNQRLVAKQKKKPSKLKKASNFLSRFTLGFKKTENIVDTMTSANLKDLVESVSFKFVDIEF